LLTFQFLRYLLWTISSSSGTNRWNININITLETWGKEERMIKIRRQTEKNVAKILQEDYSLE
jgi:hypothetical protein